MTNAATLNTSNKNINNCGRIQYVLKTNKQTNKLLMSETSQHTNSAIIKKSK